MTHGPRPNDHLVEPMYSALGEPAAPEEPARRAPRRLWIALAIAGLAGIGALFINVFAAG